MSKIRLDLDLLQVDTFEPEARGSALRGTVQGHQRSYFERCVATETRGLVWTTCDQPSYVASCRQTCLCPHTADCATADCPTADCATQNLSCGLTCRCNATLQLVACTGD
jgi:hypothetical protein